MNEFNEARAQNRALIISARKLIRVLDEFDFLPKESSVENLRMYVNDLANTEREIAKKLKKQGKVANKPGGEWFELDNEIGNLMEEAKWQRVYITNFVKSICE